MAASECYDDDDVVAVQLLTIALLSAPHLSRPLPQIQSHWASVIRRWTAITVIVVFVVVVCIRWMVGGLFLLLLVFSFILRRIAT